MALGKDHPLWSILQDLVSYIPAVIVLIAITSDWDGELWLLAALGAGSGGKAFLRSLKEKQS